MLREMLSVFADLHIMVNTIAKISSLAKIFTLIKLTCFYAKNQLNHI